MHRARNLTLVFVAALCLVGTAQQTPSAKPNFSGVWNGIPDPTPLPPRKADELEASPDWSSPLTLTQTATTLTATYRSNKRSHADRKFVYNLDGTESANQLTGAVDPTGRRSTAIWNGNSLVLTDAVDWPYPAGTTTKRLDRKALTLESQDVLRVEATLVLGDRTSAPKVIRFKRAAGR